jgi:hypothetical protein
MSQENVEIVRRRYEHFAATGDYLAETHALDFVWDMSKFRDWPEQQTYEGVEGARVFLRDWLTTLSLSARSNNFACLVGRDVALMRLGAEDGIDREERELEFGLAREQTVGPARRRRRPLAPAASPSLIEARQLANHRAPTKCQRRTRRTAAGEEVARRALASISPLERRAPG